MPKKKCSSGDTRGLHPYQRITFWLEAKNQFWNTDYYTDKSREYYQNWLTDELGNMKNISSLQEI